MAEQPTEKPLGRWKLPLTAVLLVAAVVGVAWWLVQRPVAQPIVIPTPGGDGRQVKVDVAGAVARPGLYSLAAGLRVADAIEAAGGATDAADLAHVNLAARLRDGQQLVVPTVVVSAAPAPAQSGTAAPASALSGPAPAAAPTASSRTTRVAAPRPDAKLNLNRATEPELEALPGVGPVTANRILEYREKNGPFTTPDDLRTARLVTTRAWEQIKDLVTAP